jgi:hypothetical protein
MMRWAAALAVSAAPAFGQCSQALVLAIDVSASVDPQEYVLQSEGLAFALTEPLVMYYFLNEREAPVWLAAYEWSGSRQQRLVLDWMPVTSESDLHAAADAILAARRSLAQGTTGIGAALLYGGELFARGPDCPEKTLDVSGDGQNNDWPPPEEARYDPSLFGVKINGLVIGANFPMDHLLNPNRVGALTAYYEDRVIKGEEAFVEVADNFSDFGRTMRRKLIRELGGVEVSGLWLDWEFTQAP